MPAGDEATSKIYKTPSGIEFRVEVVAKNLEIPWAIAFAPDGRMFVTERPGRVRLVEDGKLQSEPLVVIREVEHVGEGGLMGLALDPQFFENHFIYLSYTYRSSQGLAIKIVRRAAPPALHDPQAGTPGLRDDPRFQDLLHLRLHQHPTTQFRR